MMMHCVVRIMTASAFKRLLVIESCNVTHNIMMNPSNVEVILKSYAITAMYMLHGNCSGMGNGDVTVVIDGSSRKVIANKPMKKDQLLLTAFSLNFTVPKEDKKRDPKDNFVHVDLGKHKLTAKLHAPALNANKANSDGVCPFWFVMAAIKPDQINAQLSIHNMVIGEATVTIPCIRNTKDLKKGMEIGIAPRS